MKKFRHLFLITYLVLFVSLLNVNALSALTASQLQSVTITGTVNSYLDKQPLIGVVVKEKDGKASSITDIDGNFKISVSNPDATLIFTYVGFNDEEVSVVGKSNIALEMAEKIEAIKEVVVVGYGTQKKSDATGSIAQVKSDEIKNTASPQLSSALQGKASGVYIMNKSGKAGGDVDVSIRGVTSINGGDNAGPLWVIDGVPSDGDTYKTLNTNDIETVDIIKDGTAAAIYGVRAAAGVIMVTTKRGVGEKKPKISFNAYSGISNPWRLPEMLNSDQYLELKREQWDITSNDVKVSGFKPDYADTLKAAGKYYNTNWMKEMFRQGKTQNFDLSVTGATESSNYYIGASYFNEKASFIDNSYNKYSLRLNSDYKIIKWLKVGESLNMVYTQTNPVADEERYIQSIFRTPPLMPVYDKNNQPGGFGYVEYQKLGDYNGSNPLAGQLMNKIFDDYNQINGNAYITANLFKGFSVTSTFSGTFSLKDNKTVNYPYFLSDQRNVSTTSVISEFQRNWYMLGNVYANYTREFGVHNINATVGYEASKNSERKLKTNASDARYGLEVIDQTDNAKRFSEGSEKLGRTLSQFGRVTYQFNNKYIVQGIVRRDGSDKFGSDNRYGIFPSGSVAWKISETDFIKNFPIISFLKVRGGYGINGNNNIDQYLYAQYMKRAQSYPYGNYSSVKQNPAVRLSSSMANPAIKWEQSKQLDMGLELGLWKNKLFINVEIYQKSIDNMLFYQSLPLSSGFGQQFDTKIRQPINAGLIENKGLDFSAIYKDNFDNFKYSISANVSTFNWEVKKLTDSNPIFDNEELSAQTKVSRTVVGNPGGMFWGYQTLGIFQNQAQVDEFNARAKSRALELNPNVNINDVFYTAKGTAPGDLIYKDTDGDGKITSNDRTIIGNPWPKATYGLQITAEYKLFDFLIAGSGLYKRDVFNSSRASMYQFNSYDFSTTTLALQRWTPNNNSTTNYRISSTDPNGNLSKPSSWYVEDGSFFRIKNLQIGFTIPKNWSQSIKIERFRVYVSGQNLYTWTNYSGFDPEFGIGDPTGAGVDGGSYPQARIYLMGLQLDF